MNREEAIKILSHMATISDLIEGEENAEKRTEAVSMAMVALMAPKKLEGWLARDWIGGNLVFFKEKPTTKRAGMWEDAEGNTGGVLTRYGHDDFDIEWESEPVHVELSIMSATMDDDHCSNEGIEELAKFIRGHLAEIPENAQKEFERIYTKTMGKKMYGGFKD